MKNFLMAFAVILLVARAPAGATQNAPAQPATPEDPVTTIIEAFRTHNIVALTDPHGNVQVQAFLLSLVRSPLPGSGERHRHRDSERALPGRA